VSPVHEAERDWMVVAPWWKWSDPVDPQVGRLTQPVFQKYETSDVANAFLKDPQRSLKFVQEDLVHSVQAAPAIPLGLGGRLRRFSEKVYLPDGTNTRKLFLDAHKRFYLVVCSIHCDGPGLPRAARAKVCEAGFVVRRRTARIPAPARAEGLEIVQQIGSTRRRLAVANMMTAGSAQTAASTTLVGAMTQQARAVTQLRQRASTIKLLELERVRLEEWVDRVGVTAELQGWFPSARDRIGSWEAVESRPEDPAGEAVFRLRPLIPDPNDREHAGQFGTIYFGLLPTSSADADERGQARFDDTQFYEVQCFVRRHHRPHPPGTPCPCPDRLFWSQSTEPYKIAAHFDLDGTSNRPVTVQLPDLPALAAQARPTAGVSFARPEGSVQVSGGSGGPIPLGLSGAPQICSFSIPLITIVAMFVFEIFLPIVVLLFGLFFLLKLRFCFSPSIDLSASVAAELSLTETTTTQELGMEAAVSANVDAAFPAQPEMRSKLKGTFSPVALANMARQQERAAVKGPDSGVIEWEVRKEHA